MKRAVAADSPTSFAGDQRESFFRFDVLRPRFSVGVKMNQVMTTSFHISDISVLFFVSLGSTSVTNLEPC